MLSVLNKAKIESMIKEFYLVAGLADNHDPLRISKLSAVSQAHFSVGDADDEFEDEDFGYDHALGMVFDNRLSDTFYIKPSTAFISNDPDGMAFEWVPKKPVYVTSKDDLIKLYESFVNYLETTHELCSSWHGFKPFGMDLILCFSDLHYSETVEPGAAEPQNINVLFGVEHFRPEYTVIRTLNGVFRYAELPRYDETPFPNNPKCEKAVQKEILNDVQSLVRKLTALTKM